MTKCECQKFWRAVRAEQDFSRFAPWTLADVRHCLKGHALITYNVRESAVAVVVLGEFRVKYGPYRRVNGFDAAELFEDWTPEDDDLGSRL